MKQLLVLWLLANFPLQSYQDSFEDTEDSRPIPTVEVERIKIHGERKHIIVGSGIHTNRTQFDVYVKVIRELGSNNLVMNSNIRAKFKGEKDFKRILEMKRLDFCAWLTEYKSNFFLQGFFKKSMDISDIIVCPIRLGNYSLTNINMANNVYPQNMVPGNYKYFVEIVEITGDIPKVFALQLTTKIYIIST
ncbi:hypothetical protein ACLKA7_009252 [Drosophila subpalustris]